MTAQSGPNYNPYGGGSTTSINPTMRYQLATSNFVSNIGSGMGMASAQGAASGVLDSVNQFKGAIGPAMGIWNPEDFAMTQNT